MSQPRVAVLGAGAWGLTLADLLACKGCCVGVWDCDLQLLERLRQTRRPGKPPELQVHESVQFHDEFSAAVGDTEIVVSAVPSFAVRSVCARLNEAPGGLGGRIYVSCSKGIEEETLMLPSEIFGEAFGSGACAQFSILSGPSHAEEVCRRMPTVVVSCSCEVETAERVRDLFFLPSFRVYTQTDCRGVELGGALKNVIAIAAGITDGLGFGDNTKAALITRGLAEIARAGAAMGAQPQTLAGLAGLGDLIVTAMSRHSRNRAFGELIGQGMDTRSALEKVGAVVEGYRTSKSAHGLGLKAGIEMPLTDAVFSVLHEGRNVRETSEMLLQRLPKPEIY